MLVRVSFSAFRANPTLYIATNRLLYLRLDKVHGWPSTGPLLLSVQASDIARTLDQIDWTEISDSSRLTVHPTQFSTRNGVLLTDFAHRLGHAYSSDSDEVGDWTTTDDENTDEEDDEDDMPDGHGEEGHSSASSPA